jgi:hypothetical protein
LLVNLPVFLTLFRPDIFTHSWFGVVDLT